MRARLAEFKAEHGHCRVPRNNPADPKLGNWVGNQRRCKKRHASDPSPILAAERVAKLEALGFEWSVPIGGGVHKDEAGWEAMRARLAAFNAEHGHCRVSDEHRQLGRWVASQRKYRKRLDAGRPSPEITAERVAQLEALGFEWSLPPAGGNPSKKKR